MNSRSLPADDHVVRYVRPTHIEEDEVDADAFILRASEEHLSVNWLEKLPGDRQHQLATLRRLLRLRLARNGRLATLNVGRTKAFLASYRHSIDVISDPLPATDLHPADPSHAGITDLPSPRDHSAAVFVGALLAQCIEPPLDAARTD